MCFNSCYKICKLPFYNNQWFLNKKGTERSKRNIASNIANVMNIYILSLIFFNHSMLYVKMEIYKFDNNAQHCLCRMLAVGPFDDPNHQPIIFASLIL